VLVISENAIVKGKEPISLPSTGVGVIPDSDI